MAFGYTIATDAYTHNNSKKQLVAVGLTSVGSNRPNHLYNSVIIGVIIRVLQNCKICFRNYMFLRVIHVFWQVSYHVNQLVFLKNEQK